MKIRVKNVFKNVSSDLKAIYFENSNNRIITRIIIF